MPISLPWHRMLQLLHSLKKVFDFNHKNVTTSKDSNILSKINTKDYRTH